MARNFVLFTSDLFVACQQDEHIDNWSLGGDCAGWFYARLLLGNHIQRQSEPVMEDWGWSFAVRVDNVIIRVSVWEYFELENCWLLGLNSESKWFRPQSPETLSAAKEAVVIELDKIMSSDKRFSKRAWFEANPFELKIDKF